MRNPTRRPRRESRPRPGNRELYDHLRVARKALFEVDHLLPWFYVGDLSDGPACGALLYLARAVLATDMDLMNEAAERPSPWEQPELPFARSGR
jgi:hypothetical protein